MKKLAFVVLMCVACAPAGKSMSDRVREYVDRFPNPVRAYYCEDHRTFYECTLLKKGGGAERFFCTSDGCVGESVWQPEDR